MIQVRDNEYRRVGDGIKNVHSRRQIPIAQGLLPWLCDLPAEGILFPEYLSRSGRLNTPSFLRGQLGIGPHTLRHHAATCLREAGFNERVIGDLLGHAPSKATQTSRYGATTLTTLREAVEKIY
jgi:integrase